MYSVRCGFRSAFPRFHSFELQAVDSKFRAQDAVHRGWRGGAVVGRAVVKPMIDCDVEHAGRREALDLVVPEGGQQQRAARGHVHRGDARVAKERVCYTELSDEFCLREEEARSSRAREA